MRAYHSSWYATWHDTRMGRHGQAYLANVTKDVFPHMVQKSLWYIYWATKFLPMIHFDVGTGTGIGMLSPITHKMNSHHKYGLLLIMGYILGLMCGLVFHWAWPMWLIELIYANNSFYVLWGPTHGLHVLFSFVLCLANMAQGISPMLTLVQWWIHYINQWYVCIYHWHITTFLINPRM